MYTITIDRNSGFCFGVVRAIAEAEKQLALRRGTEENFYCLGEIVHNNEEVERLQKAGLQVIDNERFHQLPPCSRVLIRAHGEPPETYRKARENHIELVDATCPIVLRLQQRIKAGFEQMKQIGGQVLIYGKAGHAEVIGLNGQTGNRAHVVGSLEDMKEIDFSRPTLLYAQTTMNAENYRHISDYAAKRCARHQVPFTAVDSICKSMSLRAERLREFARRHQAVVFVSGRQSSNGKYLYGICRENNPHTFFISQASELNADDFVDIEGKVRFDSVGICGATSTPMWLMEEAAERIREFTGGTQPLNPTPCS